MWYLLVLHILTKVIKEEGTRAIGTVRADTLGSLKVKKTDVTKQERDTIDKFYEKNEIFAVTWNDNGLVTVISTTHIDVPHISLYDGTMEPLYKRLHKTWSPGLYHRI